MPRGNTLLKTLFLCVFIQTIFASQVAETNGIVKEELAALKVPEVINDENVMQVEDLSVQPPSRAGLVNHANICYMNSVITSLFGAIPFRSLIYSSTPKSSVMFFLAQLFARLQSSTEEIRTDLFFMPIFKKTYPDWNFGPFQCSLEFASLIFEQLGKEICQQLRLGAVIHRYLETEESVALVDDVIGGVAGLSDLAKFEVYSGVDMDEFRQIYPCYPSIQDAFDSGFRDQSYEAKVEVDLLSEILGSVVEPDPLTAEEIAKGKKDPTAKTVRVFNFSVITETPEVFVLGINRGNLASQQSNKDRMEVNPTLDIIDGEGTIVTYLLQSFAYFIEKDLHYISYVCDYSQNDGKGVWYRYNDSIVSVVSSEADLELMYELAATCATFVVYVRQDKVHMPVPEVPDRFETFAIVSQTIDNIAVANETAAQAKYFQSLAKSAASAPTAQSSQSGGFGPNHPNTQDLSNAFPVDAADEYVFVAQNILPLDVEVDDSQISTTVQTA